MSKHGILKLCDFGFARPLGGPGARYTDYVATRWYRSPELLAGDTQYGRGVDIWAIGCMFAEIYTGMPLFPGESDIDQLFQIVRCQGNLTDHLAECLRKNPLFEGVEVPHVAEPETLKRRLPQFDNDMITFISACLGNDPSSRATCSELLEMPYFHGFQDWWAQEFKKLAEKDLVGYRGRYRKRTKKPSGNPSGHGADQRSSELADVETEARKRLDAQRKSMEDERQSQVSTIIVMVPLDRTLRFCTCRSWPQLKPAWKYQPSILINMKRRRIENVANVANGRNLSTKRQNRGENQEKQEKQRKERGESETSEIEIGIENGVSVSVSVSEKTESGNCGGHPKMHSKKLTNSQTLRGVFLRTMNRHQ